MAELIVFAGNQRVTVRPTQTTCYLYKIGSGQVECEGVIEINDGTRLNELATQVRDNYSVWVHSLNKDFLKAGLTINNLSLFFLTDISCKRSEFFETFNIICSLLLIREKLEGVNVTKARLIGVEEGFGTAFQSLFPATTVTVVNESESAVTSWKRFLSDSLYLFRLASALVVNFSMKRKQKYNSHPIRMFFSIYPQMFSADGVETKYGSYVNDTDGYGVSILTDGMHQKTGIINYIRWKKEAKNRGLIVIDEFLNCVDLISGFYWLGKVRVFIFGQRNQSYNFEGIDITKLIRIELLFSMSRVMRLCVLMGAVKRFIQNTNIKELIYYPCEYPIGRMISYVAKSSNSKMLRTGFQMSIVSQRRLEQFLAPRESASCGAFFDHVPVPDRCLVEDHKAASIYRYAGYPNVEIMDRVYRYEHLDGLVPEKRPGWVLIAPGLHDGALMLDQLGNELANHPDYTYLLKPHPRAHNGYLNTWSSIRNLQITEQPIEELLAIVSHVFVTYSSVGVESKRVGIDVTVINIPGRVNASPLLD